MLRTVEPGIDEITGKTVLGIQRIGKRIVIEFEQDYFVVIHLMVAGRLRWKKANATVPKSNGLAAFDFEHGSSIFTEASKKKRASIHLVQNRSKLAPFDRGGLEAMTADAKQFRAAVGEGFPDKVTAFHESMAVHGRYNQPCPVCEAPVMRIRFAENEANYCALPDRRQGAGRSIAIAIAQGQLAAKH